jgi:hypothetical protein
VLTGGLERRNAWTRPRLQGRDVFNEKPAEAELVGADANATSAVLPPAATLHTSLGDIMIRLHGEQCPRSVENFATHAKSGYYDGIIFHRIIKNFMIQTGALQPTAGAGQAAELLCAGTPASAPDAFSALLDHQLHNRMTVKLSYLFFSEFSQHVCHLASHISITADCTGRQMHLQCMHLVFRGR